MRKIKLMALLLAALMVVTAFAGCAGVKQEVVNDLDDRVSKIEDLLVQQNDTIKDLGDKVGASDNSDVLAALESMNKDLSDKIADIEDRVKDVEEKPAGNVADATVQAKQTEALASIAVQKAEFDKNSDEYDKEANDAITSAFAKAQAEVTAATTEAGVKAAMATLATTLDAYKTYAMKLYDFYIALLGNINDDAEELVETALEFIDVVEEVYEDADDIAEELEYVVAEATGTTRAKKLDVYNAVKALCEAYEGSASTTVSFQYVDAKGNVKTFTGKTLAGYKAEAKSLVTEIKNTVGKDGLTYKILAAMGNVNGLESLQEDYNDYVKAAEFVGGEALVDLVTNADLLVEALEIAENLYDAVEAYEELNGRISGSYRDAFYYYTDVANKATGLVITDPDDAEEVLFLDEFYTENVDEVIADWIDEFNLTAADAEAIIDDMEDEAGFYKTYVQNRRKVALVDAAYVEFTKNIVPSIKALNKLTSKSADAVEDFNTTLEAVEALYKLQDKNVKSENYADQIDITLDAATFAQFVEQSGVVAVDDIKLYQVEEADDNDVDALIASLNAGRLANVTTAITNVQTITARQFVELFTFASDIKELDKDATGATDDYIALRNTGKIYNFFAVEFSKAESFANDINGAIKYLANRVENNKISSTEDFVKLAGEYVLLAQANDEFEVVYDNGTADTTDDIKYTNAHDDADKYYVIAADALNYAEDYEDFDVLTAVVTDGIYVSANVMDDNENVTVKNVFTIDFFNFAFPTFTSLIKVDEFEAAAETAETRINGLFDDIDELKALLEEVAYVRVAKGEGATAYEFKDLNGNGINDFGDEFPYDTNKNGIKDSDEDWSEAVVINTNAVSLNDKAKFDAAVKIYDEWVFAGGNENLKKFVEVVDDEGVYTGTLYAMEGFAAADGVGAVLTTLRTLDANFKALTTAANKFVNGVKLVGDVNSYNSISATSSTNKLSGDSEIDRWAVTKFVNSDSTTDHAGVNGTWTYVYLNNDGTLTTANYVDTASVYTTGVATGLKDDGKPMTKAALLKKIVEFYNAFKAANIEYVAATNNDYTVTDANAATFYVNKAYDAYKAVDDAKATYDKYDLIAAKAACFIAATATDDATTTFKGHVENATTLAALDNAIANYISVGGSIGAANLEGWTIYEFDSVDVQ